MRKASNNFNAKDIILMILRNCVNEEASCLIINTLMSGSDSYIAFAIHSVVDMLSNELYFGFGSQFIREVLKYNEDLFEYRCACTVINLELRLQKIMIDMESQFAYCAQALSLLSLLTEICSDYPMCREKLREYEPKQNMGFHIKRHIPYIAECNNEYITEDFNTLYGKFISLVSEHDSNPVN